MHNMRAKKESREEPKTAERISLTLFERDVASIKRLRAGLFADTETIASTSELIRFLLRAAPEKLNAQRFLVCREEMATEDGRAKKAN